MGIGFAQTSVRKRAKEKLQDFLEPTLKSHAISLPLHIIVQKMNKPTFNLRDVVRGGGGAGEKASLNTSYHTLFTTKCSELPITQLL